MNITLKKDRIKGIGLYATQLIHKGDNVAYYRLRVYDSKTYNIPTNFTYSFTIFTRSGRPISELIGILMKHFPPPDDNLPYWGPFVNEPLSGQEINTGFDLNLKYNYKRCNRCSPQKGYIVIYTLYALTEINIGDEILVYYGNEYARDYTLNLSECEKQVSINYISYCHT